MNMKRLDIMGLIASMMGFSQSTDTAYRPDVAPPPDLSPVPDSNRDDWDFDKPLPHHFSSKGGRKIFTINGKEIVSYSRKAAERKYRKKYGMF
jgi:hypothetical protein